MLFPAEVYLMRSGTAIEPYRHIGASMKRLIEKLLPLVDILLMPFVCPAAWLLKNIRRAGVHRLPLCKSALMNVGVFPIRALIIVSATQAEQSASSVRCNPYRAGL
jgi:hypothetical protein